MTKVLGGRGGAPGVESPGVVGGRAGEEGRDFFTDLGSFVLEGGVDRVFRAVRRGGVERCGAGLVIVGVGRGLNVRLGAFSAMIW